MVEVSVVIPAYRRVQALARALGGLAAQDGLPECCFEVVVVVDGGDAAVCALLGLCDYTKGPGARRRFTTIPEGGPAVARNAGAALARGRVLLFLDDDIIPSPTLVREHLGLHQRESGVVGLGRIDLDGARALNPFERYLYGFYDVHYRKMDRAGHQPTFWDALTGNLSMPAEAFRAAGGFDERFSLLRHEDVELAYRLGRAGLRFRYLPSAVGYHQYVKTFKRGCNEAYANGVSSVMLAQLYPELHDALIRRRWGALPLTAQLAARALWRLDRVRLLAWLDALRLTMERIAGDARPFYRVAYHLNFWRGVRDAQNGHAPRP